jgi:hypothetical protein
VGRGRASADVVDTAAPAGEARRQARCSALRRAHGHPSDGNEEISMKDVVYLLVTLVFFLLSWLYVKGLERL